MHILVGVALRSALAVTVSVAHDISVMRIGIRGVLERAPDLRVVGCADAAAVDLAREHRPDVLVLSLHQPRVERTVEAVSQVAPATRVLLIAEWVTAEVLRRVIWAGAAGVVGRPVTPELLLSAIRLIAGGDTVLPARPARAAMVSARAMGRATRVRRN